MVTWQKKGEDHYDDVEQWETVPNEDGTFQTTSRLTVKDWQTEDYTCVVQHKSLEKDIVKRVIEREIRRNQDIETRGPSMKRGAGYGKTNTSDTESENSELKPAVKA
ncbi:hypothetical protein AAFF_G00031450 [Aldrovandia affinis]|uniref:Ig-like domain-containing protein n=1 Tax=Aldrovandia affinis TaxID=143900 RepID=A0AAD7R2L3_9TELE|nr:hypothetical protein AAFF_G00031450 [Aldrovandia affinis]